VGVVKIEAMRHGGFRRWCQCARRETDVIYEKNGKRENDGRNKTLLSETAVEKSADSCRPQLGGKGIWEPASPCPKDLQFLLGR